MADAQPWSDSESPATAAQPPGASAPAEAAPGDAAPVEDPLAGDWSEGLLGAARPHGLPLPERIEPPAAAPVEQAPARRSAEEVMAEAAGKLPTESLRTEQASAPALMAAGEHALAQGEPTVHVAHEPSVIVPEEAAPATVATESMQLPGAAMAARAAVTEITAAVVTETVPLPGAAPEHAEAQAAAAPPHEEAVALPAPAPVVTETVPMPAPSHEEAIALPAPEEDAVALPGPALGDDHVAAAIASALALEPPAASHEDAQQPAADLAGHDVWQAALEHAPPEHAADPSAPTPWSESTEGQQPAAVPHGELWSQTAAAAAGPEVWSEAAPVTHAWGAGPAAAHAPDWSAAQPDHAAASDWQPAPADALVQEPPPVAQMAPLDEDLPALLPEAAEEPAPAARPAFLHGEARVVVHTLAGRVKRGTLRNADLESPDLLLALPSGGAEERIALADVKAVFFMLAPGEQPPPPPGGRVRVTLSDGRQLDGFREAEGPGGGLFLVPLDAARTNTRAIFVCGDAIQAIDQT